MSRPLLVYRLLLPVYLLVAMPAWLVKMARRGGFGTPLLERAARYGEPPELEPCGAVHLHAVSVGEALLAVKLIRAWREREPEREFVLAVGTATGRAVAEEAGIERLRVVYQPVDLDRWVRAYLDRFEPGQLVLVEGEMWPNLMRRCRGRGIAVRLVNARMSPRSRRRYRRFASWVRPVFSQLGGVATQDPDAEIWTELGVPAERVVATGSLKFDPGPGPRPRRREGFGRMIEACAAGRPVVLAASTHPGEEEAIARAVRAAGGFPLCVPRHAERRESARLALEREGFEVVLRSRFAAPSEPGRSCLVVDSTGELRDWTAHAELVVIGKSFLGEGGQNPAEAILAGKRLVFGPHMENFEPLASQLVAGGGARRVGLESLEATLRRLLAGDGAAMPEAASAVLARHQGACGRVLDWLGAGR